MNYNQPNYSTPNRYDQNIKDVKPPTSTYKYLGESK